MKVIKVIILIQFCLIFTLSQDVQYIDRDSQGVQIQDLINNKHSATQARLMYQVEYINKLAEFAQKKLEQTNPTSCDGTIPSVLSAEEKNWGYETIDILEQGTIDSVISIIQNLLNNDGNLYYDRSTNTCTTGKDKECNIYKKLMNENFIAIGAALNQCGTKIHLLLYLANDVQIAANANAAPYTIDNTVCQLCPTDKEGIQKCENNLCSYMKQDYIYKSKDLLYNCAKYTDEGQCNSGTMLGDCPVSCFNEQLSKCPLSNNGWCGSTMVTYSQTNMLDKINEFRNKIARLPKLLIDSSIYQIERAKQYVQSGGYGKQYWPDYTRMTATGGLYGITSHNNPNKNQNYISMINDWIAESAWYNYEDGSCQAGKTCDNFKQLLANSNQHIYCLHRATYLYSSHWPLSQQGRIAFGCSFPVGQSSSVKLNFPSNTNFGAIYKDLIVNELNKVRRNKNNLAVKMNHVVWDSAFASAAQNNVQSQCNIPSSIPTAYSGFVFDFEKNTYGLSEDQIINKIWTEYKKYYNYETNQCNNDPNGQTQNNCHAYKSILFNSASKIGCARKYCNTKTIVLCLMDQEVKINIAYKPFAQVNTYAEACTGCAICNNRLCTVDNKLCINDIQNGDIDQCRVLPGNDYQTRQLCGNCKQNKCRDQWKQNPANPDEQTDCYEGMDCSTLQLQVACPKTCKFCV